MQFTISRKLSCSTLLLLIILFLISCSVKRDPPRLESVANQSDVVVLTEYLGSPATRQLTFLDLNSGERTSPTLGFDIGFSATQNHEPQKLSVEFSPTDKYILTNSKEGWFIIDTSTYEFNLVANQLDLVEFLPDGTLIVFSTEIDSFDQAGDLLTWKVSLISPDNPSQTREIGTNVRYFFGSQHDHCPQDFSQNCKTWTLVDTDWRFILLTADRTGINSKVVSPEISNRAVRFLQDQDQLIRSLGELYVIYLENDENQLEEYMRDIRQYISNESEYTDSELGRFIFQRIMTLLITNPTQFLDADSEINLITVSPDGAKIIFIAPNLEKVLTEAIFSLLNNKEENNDKETEQTLDLTVSAFLIDIDSGTEKNLSSNIAISSPEELSLYAPKFSPDGNQILFYSNLDFGSEHGQPRFYLSDKNGENIIQLDIPINNTTSLNWN